MQLPDYLILNGPMPKGAARANIVVKLDGKTLYGTQYTLFQSDKPEPRTEEEARISGTERAIQNGIDNGYFTETDVPRLEFEFPERAYCASGDKL
jgi:hypothetical protein